MLLDLKVHTIFLHILLSYPIYFVQLALTLGWVFCLFLYSELETHCSDICQKSVRSHTSLLRELIL